MLDAREDVLELLGRGHISRGACYDMSKLSHNGQGRVLRAIASEELDSKELNKLCHRILAEENQTEMFPETQVTEEEKRTIKTFGEAFGQICRTLERLQRMEDRQPGLMARALSTESHLVESQVVHCIRGLAKVKKALMLDRIGKLAEAQAAD